MASATKILETKRKRRNTKHAVKRNKAAAKARGKKKKI